MRDVEFRGKDAETGKWVFGSLMVWKDGVTEINTNERGEGKNAFCDKKTVIPETVGQWTGLLDKNGVKIFEGDKLYSSELLIYCTEKNDERFAVVVWDDNNACYVGDLRTTCTMIKAWKFSAYEVIGNIHDNPELLHANIQTDF